MSTATIPNSKNDSGSDVMRTSTELRVSVDPSVIARNLRLIVLLLAIVGTVVVS